MSKRKDNIVKIPLGETLHFKKVDENEFAQSLVYDLAKWR